MNKPLLKHLRATRALLAEPENWIKGRNAADARHRTVTVGSIEACQFCLMGAAWTSVKEGRDERTGIVEFAYLGTTSLAESARLREIVNALSVALPKGANSLTSYNDQSNRTHDEVLAVIDRAIAKEEAA